MTRSQLLPPLGGAITKNQSVSPRTLAIKSTQPAELRSRESPTGAMAPCMLLLLLAAALAPTQTRAGEYRAGRETASEGRGGIGEAASSGRPPDPPPLLHPRPEPRALLPSQPAQPPGVW